MALLQGMYRRLSPGGHVTHHVSMSAPSVVDSVADSGRGTASVSIVTSAMTLRERIAHIEKQLSVSLYSLSPCNLLVMF